MNKEEIIVKIKAFVEGELEAQEIIKYYKTDSAFKIFCDKNQGPHVQYQYKSFANFMDRINEKNPNHIYNLAFYLRYPLFLSKVTFNATDKYLIEAEKFDKIFPSWLPDNAYDYIENFIEPNMPQGLNEKEQKAWLKQEVKQAFRYEKKPPQFVQGGDWPMDENNKPLVFRKQTTKGEQTIFIFVDENTKEETTYEELY